VPTFNESEVIERRLSNIAELDFPHEKMQVIVVDSASTDSTCDIVRRFAKEHSKSLSVTLVQRPVRLGKADAINEALRQATSEYFVLTDADVTSPPNALSQLISNFREPTVGGASGVEIPETEDTLASSIETGYKAAYTAVRMAESSVDTPFMCESEFSAYRRTIVKPLRSGCMCDDIELTVGLRSTGFKGVYDSQAVFFEREAGTFRSKLTHKLRRGMANQHALIRTRSALFNRRFGSYGRIVFPFEFFVHIISPILITTDLALILLILAMSPIQGTYGIIIPLVLVAPALGMCYSLTRKYDTGRLMRLRRGSDLIAGAAAFIFFQVALLGSLLQLGVRGPRLKWEKISETRSAPSTGTKNS
jgi:cellulose synthase/poly-beta-1,6-N-acetylglucosamine synthase-like glycosyltransferase